MRTFLLVLLGCLSGAAFAAEAEETSDVVDRLINTTDLGKNLQTLDDYYSQINQKLNKQVKNRHRDPFERLARPELKVEQKATKPRFIPRQKTAESLGASSILNKTLAGQREQDQGLLPVMQFRGFIKSDEEKAGLLEIEGQGTFVVHEGDKVGLQQLGGDMVIRVVEINALNLIVEFGSLGEKVVVQ
ncbi:hypothetical protein ACMXYQ_03470 [Neptuniibacter sp. PT34_22]|uniref:hypothetical protein n=1 Tax=Neptuniibacter sp. PT34_22 TaxID=3398205 RepID=UPI0039F45382